MSGELARESAPQNIAERLREQAEGGDFWAMAILLQREVEALRNVETAARELDALFDGDSGAWTLEGREVAGDASVALLSLHDYLNDVDRARSGDG